jgi:pimeloyl-ACP methyl ester carboxylesterase
LPPKTQYARSGNLHIAYQVVGTGPRDLVYVPGWVSNVELAWEEPTLAQFLNRLASFSRLIVFDKRGTGLSDRVPPAELPPLEERMDDLRAVMDAAGSERATIFGASEGGNLSALFAASHPERTTGLALFGTFAKRVWSADYPWAPTVDERNRQFERAERAWGEPADFEHYVPSKVNDEAFMRRLGAYFRSAASPGAAVALLRMNTGIDIRHVLPSIHVPALVLNRTGDRSVNVAEGRWMAAQIPDARFVELPGEDHMPWVGDQDAILDEVQEFVTGNRPLREPDRVLATVLVTDIVGSTQHATRLGDRAWSELLTQHQMLVRKELASFRGREVDTAGDSFLATFDGPARAVGCACRIRDAGRALGIEIRAGLHTGEIELAGEQVRGIAVHTGARIAAVAQPGEILVSSTITDLVSGSGIRFEDRGLHALKDIPRQWQLFAAGG